MVREALAAVERSTSALDLPARVTELAATLEFLDRRPGALARWLEPEPPLEPDEKGGAAEGTARHNPFEPVPRAPGATAISSRLALDRAELGRGLLHARASLSGPGRISLLGSFGPREGRRHACAVAPREATAGTVSLRCRLTATARKRLARRPPLLRLAVRFAPADGTPPRTVERLVRLPRQAR